jgi:hypothetical protein
MQQIAPYFIIRNYQEVGRYVLSVSSILFLFSYPIYCTHLFHVGILVIRTKQRVGCASCTTLSTGSLSCVLCTKCTEWEGSSPKLLNTISINFDTGGCNKCWANLIFAHISPLQLSLYIGLYRFTKNGSSYKKDKSIYDTENCSHHDRVISCEIFSNEALVENTHFLYKHYKFSEISG